VNTTAIIVATNRRKIRCDRWEVRLLVLSHRVFITCN